MKTTGMRKIGRGMFSTAYLKNKNTVLIKTTDKAKLCMSERLFPKSRMFPKLKKIDITNNYCFYEMEYYPRVGSLRKALLPEEFEFYQILRKLKKEKMASSAFDYNKSYDWRAFFRMVWKKIPAKFAYKRKILLQALDTMYCYGQDVCFEISPRNVAVKNGKLILLDCFFFENDLNKAFDRSESIAARREFQREQRFLAELESDLSPFQA